MTFQLQIGDLPPANIDLLQSLSEHQLMPAVLKALVIDHAIADLTLTPQEELIALQQFYEQQQIKDEENEQQWLAHHRMSKTQLEQQALRQLKLTKYKAQRWNSVLESDFLKYEVSADKVCAKEQLPVEVLSALSSKDPKTYST